jgi:serine/threonine-protein phosphatase 2A regulatory subunit B
MLKGPYSCEYKFFTEFQSHEAEFDYLKSLEIEEKINQIAWCKRPNNALFLLSTNDKTIKLWKIYEKKMKYVANMNVEQGRYGGASYVSSLRVPTVTSSELAVVTTPKRIYGNAHVYHINSISVNSDSQTFLSADDLRVNLWNLENAKIAYNLIDMKPPTLEELTEVITSATFHPISCNTFMYSSSRGSIRLADMRMAALCDNSTKVFEEIDESATNKSYFYEIIASISDAKFTNDGRYIIARDYLTVKIWDTHMESRPVQVIPIHEYLRPKLVDLYESDCIFDRFEVSPACKGSSFITGTYNNSFKIYDTELSTESTVELTKTRPKAPIVKPIPVASSSDASQPGNQMMMDDLDSRAYNNGPIDFVHKVLHYSWHPTEDVVAVSGINNLYIWNAPPSSNSKNQMRLE